MRSFRAIGVDDGACRWLIAKGRVTFEKRENANVATRFSGTVLDVTEKILAEHELLENQRRAAKFLNVQPTPFSC